MPEAPRTLRSRKTTRKPSQRPTSTQRGYDDAWRAFRLLFIAEQFAAGRVRCELCGGVLPANGSGIHVDHIRALADGGERFARSNLRLLHAGCHSRRTCADNGGLRR